MKKHTTKNLRRSLSLVMTMLMLLTAWVFVAPTKAFAADVWDGTWDGSGFSNNHITSAKGFAKFINNAGTGTSYSGQTVYLDVDVNFNNIDFGNIDGGKNVYYSRDNYFQGTFDGQGHTIYNFQMHNSDHRIGLFRSAKNATFRNVNFESVYIDDNNNDGKNGFAAVVGWGDGNLTFENVHVISGSIYGYNYVGGLVGEYQANSRLTFTNCSNGANIHADNNRAAGLVGHSKGSVYATSCSNSGEIYAGYSDAGGIAGWIEDDESSFTNCSNTGKVSTDACAGGIFGYFGSKNQSKKMTLSGCSNTGYIESRAKIAGGIGGFLETNFNSHQIINNTNHGNVYGREDAGGIIGSNAGFGYWENNFNYGGVSCSNDNAGGILGEVEDDYQEFRNCYNTGIVQGKNSVGGILGYGNAAAHEFYDCGNGGAITSTNDSAGGIYGYGGNTQPRIEQCWNIGTIKAYNDAGGILGHTNHHSYIRRCWNAGSIETYNHDNSGAHGGIAGHTSDLSGSSNDNPNMTDCYNWGPVSGGWDDGGLIGKIKDGKTAYYITNSYNAGTVTGGRPFAIVAYGATIGNNVYYDNNVSMGTTQGTAISDGDLKNSSGFSGNYCKNTWGVKIGSTTYYYPILNWYRNLFMFHLKFVDNPSGTNAYFDGKYGVGFYAIKPTRTGYIPSDWYLSTDSNKTIAYNLDVVTCGVTPCLDSLVITQNINELTDIANTSTFNLNWEKIKQKLDMNAVLNGEYRFDNIDFFTADVYVNGVQVADDVNDFYEDLRYEDTYEIKDIKPAEGYTFVGAFLGEHEGKQQSGLTGQMGLDLIEVAPEFKSLYTVTFKDAAGNTIGEVQRIPYGGDATPPAIPDREPDADYHYTPGTWTGYTNITEDKEIIAPYNATAHTFEWITDTPATCGTAGVKHEKCTGCEVTRSLNTEIPATGEHTYTAATVKEAALKSAATCTSAAVYYYSCSVCGAVESDDEHTFTDGDPIAHTYTAATVKAEALKKAATCTAAAEYYYSCSVCGAVENDDEHTFTDGDPIAHSWGWVTDTEPTCGATGVKHEECSVCHATQSENTVIPATGAHDFQYTSKNDGTHNVTCSRCDFNAENVDCEYTSSTVGSTTTHTCKYCGYSYTTTSEEPVYCTVTFHWLTTELSQTVQMGTAATAPNVTEMYGVAGMEDGHYVFDRWHIGSPTGQPADLDHITGDIDLYGEYRVEAHTGGWTSHAATCTEAGYDDITCSTCGLYFKKANGTPALGHSWDDGVVVTEATCAHPGTKICTCQRDPSHKQTVSIPQLQHDPDANGICKNCHNPIEGLHNHTDVNGDGKCDTCGGRTDVHQHVDNDNNGVCDGCGKNMDGSFRCNLCPFYEQYKGVPVFGWFVTAVHFFYHLICQIVSWR